MSIPVVDNDWIVLMENIPNPISPRSEFVPESVEMRGTYTPRRMIQP